LEILIEQIRLPTHKPAIDRVHEKRYVAIKDRESNPLAIREEIAET
jgi:hypothetical protein